MTDLRYGRTKRYERWCRRVTGYNELRDGQEFFGNGYKKGYEDAKKEYARPKGEWIEEKSETGALGIKYTWLKCNQCGYEHSLVIPKNFCPNCGADMKEGAE